MGLFIPTISSVFRSIGSFLLNCAKFLLPCEGVPHRRARLADPVRGGAGQAEGAARTRLQDRLHHQPGGNSTRQAPGGGLHAQGGEYLQAVGHAHPAHLFYQRGGILQVRASVFLICIDPDTVFFCLQQIPGSALDPGL